MNRLDAGSLGPVALLDALVDGLLADGAVLLDHGADVAPKRLRAAMAGLTRGLSLRWRVRAGARLHPTGTAPGDAVTVIGLYARVPADLPGRDAGRFQSLWVRTDAAPAAWLALAGRPGTATLRLGDGPRADLSAWLAAE